MLKITVIDQNGPTGPATTEHNVAITADWKTRFQFKSPDFPSAALGKRFFVAGREIDVSDAGMKVEDGKAMFYFTATFVPQP